MIKENETYEMWGIKATVGKPHKFLRLNSKVILSGYTWIGGNDWANFQLEGSMSRGGRKVYNTWISISYLCNFRPQFIKECWFDHESITLCRYKTKERAQELCDQYNSHKLIKNKSE